jgi:hypothetical protein
MKSGRNIWRFEAGDLKEAARKLPQYKEEARDEEKSCYGNRSGDRNVGRHFFSVIGKGG